MRRAHRHTLAAIVATVCAWLAPPHSTAREAPVLHPDQLVILSTTDLKGKTSPCGCQVPKGGLSRLASYVDSVRTEYGQVMLLDNGGFFPEEDRDRDVAPFLMDAMRVLGVDAVGVGERDLRFGASFLCAQAKRAGLPMVCANLVDSVSHKPLLAPYVFKRVGNTRVGIFGLLSDKADTGPGGGSVRVDDPAGTARRIVAELRRKGADVVVLLGQLGTAEGEDLVSAVQGIDVLIVGHNAPFLEKGRMVGTTMACYGGEQGQFVCRTQLTLDARGRRTAASAETVMMGPEIRDKPEILHLVKSFETGMAERRRRADDDHQPPPARKTGGVETGHSGGTP